MAKHSSELVNDVNGCLRTSSSGRESHEPQVTPDRHLATDGKTKTITKINKFRVGTWNVRTLNELGKLKTILREMESTKMNILGISEMRWKGSGKIIVDKHTIIYSGGDTHEKGVGIIFDEKTSKWTLVYFR